MRCRFCRGGVWGTTTVACIPSAAAEYATPWPWLPAEAHTTPAAFASSLGYSLVMIIFAGLRERLALAEVPRLFAGPPIAFVVAGMLAMAFMGFSGIAAS